MTGKENPIVQTIDNRKLVLDFVASWEDGFDATVAAMRATLAADCVWHNSGLPAVQGIDACVALLDQARQGAGLESIETTIVAVVADGSTVAVERIDYLRRADRSLIGTLPALGIFVIEGGKISGWRDYFDPAPLLNAMSAS